MSSFCPVYPTVNNMALYFGDTKNQPGFNEGSFGILKTGVYRLELNSKVDAEQQPLKKIYIDWGDGNQQIITGQDQHPDPTNPHIFYHYYSSTGGKHIKVTIYDNWGFYNDPNAIVTNTCISWTFSGWSACSGGQQTRTATPLFPAGCTGGNPDLTRSCTPPTTCTFTYSDWSTCSSGGQQNRTVLSSTPAGCIGTPDLTRSCTPPPNTCTSWTYSDWTPATCSCGTQTRTATPLSPAGCTGGTPDVLTQDCVGGIICPPTKDCINGTCTCKEECRGIVCGLCGLGWGGGSAYDFCSADGTYWYNIPDEDGHSNCGGHYEEGIIPPTCMVGVYCE